MSNQHGTLDALCRIPHPLTPREKVARIVDPLVFELALALDNAEGEPVALRRDATEMRDMRMSEAFSKADAILTALASGSGDHAELASLAEAATPGPWETHPEAFSPRTFVIPTHHASDDPAVGSILSRQDAAFIAAANPATVLALLAEIAALRERLETARFARIEHNRQYEELRERATEAERKLAEAAGLLQEAVDEFGCTIEQYHKNGPHWTSADGEMFDAGVILDREPLIERARTFLSKEAGRG